MTSQTPADFECLRCGQCCREPGYVYLREEEIDRIATFLGMEVQAFTARYTRMTPDRRGLSLTEKDDQSCVFLGSSGCAIQAVKPLQCAVFPRIWRYRDMETVCKGWNEKRNA